MTNTENKNAIQIIMKMFDIDEDSATVLFDKNYFDKNGFVVIDEIDKIKYSVQRSYNDFDLTSSYLLLDVSDQNFTIESIVRIMSSFKFKEAITFIGNNNYFLYKDGNIIGDNIDNTLAVNDIIISKKDFILAFS